MQPTAANNTLTLLLLLGINIESALAFAPQSLLAVRSR